MVWVELKDGHASPEARPDREAPLFQRRSALLFGLEQSKGTLGQALTRSGHITEEELFKALTDLVEP